MTMTRSEFSNKTRMPNITGVWPGFDLPKPAKKALAQREAAYEKWCDAEAEAVTAFETYAAAEGADLAAIQAAARAGEPLPDAPDAPALLRAVHYEVTKTQAAGAEVSKANDVLVEEMRKAGPELVRQVLARARGTWTRWSEAEAQAQVIMSKANEEFRHDMRGLDAIAGYVSSRGMNYRMDTATTFVYGDRNSNSRVLEWLTSLVDNIGRFVPEADPDAEQDKPEVEAATVGTGVA